MLFLFSLASFNSLVFFLAFGDYRFSIHINCKFSIVEQICDISHNIQGNGRSDIKEFSVLTNPQIS